MKPSHAAFFVIVGAMVFAVPTSGVLAQTPAPSTSDIEKALTPIPKALQGGHQGVSAGAVVHFPSDRPTTPVSVTMPATGGAAKGSTGMAAARCAPSGAEPGTLSLPQITFDFDSAVLKPEAKTVLENLGTALNRGLSGQKLFVLEGHTDTVGTADYNENLSLRRAVAARDFLVTEMKVDPSRLQTVGKGFAGLADPCHPRAAENRRIVVINPAQEG